MRHPIHKFKVILILTIVLCAGVLSAGQWNAVIDGGFENGSPNSDWNEMPSGIILNDPTFAHSGNWVATMGMAAYPTTSLDYFLSQNVIMGTGDSTLQFWFRWEFSSENDMDYIRAWIDGNVVFEQYANQGTAPGQFYEPIVVPVGQYPDGLPHELKFEVHLEGTSYTGFGSLFYVDDVELITEDLSTPLNAGFHWNPALPNPGQSIQFIDDTAGDPDIWTWDFGDGNQSSTQNPTHTYLEPGDYVVDLAVTRNADEAQDSIQKQVHVHDPLFPEFSWSPEEPLPGEQVSFSNQSTGGADSFFWDFGDGSTSTLENPSHVWTDRGSYQVTLDITRSSDSAHSSVQHWITVAEELFPEFTWDPLNPVAGQEISFLDTSTGNPDSWEWDFGDGATASTAAVNHIYDAPGTFTVSLTVGRSLTGNVQTRVVTHSLNVADAPHAEFSWDPLEPHAGETVLFNNQSIGNPLSASWDFGDGSTSEEPNPAHIFEAAGSYVVSLTMQFTLPGGLDLEDTVTETITVSEASLQAAFNWSPQPAIAGAPTHFQDLSTGDIVSRSWDFGDGETSGEQTPVHVFADPGLYEVSLQVGDSSGDVSSRTREVEVISDDLQADFNWDPEFPRPGEQLEFSDLSTGTPMFWNWDFGDGRHSNEQNPVLRFMSEGSYLVTLKVAYDESRDTLRLKSRWLTVSRNAPHADFFWMPLLPRTGENIEFYDLSTGEPDSWAWEFGDGTSSLQQNPVHAFESEGNYDVTLQVDGGTDSRLSDSITRRIRVVNPVEIDFSWAPEEPKAQEAVHFHEAVDEDAVFLFWNFGDGQNSRESEPSHIFARAGHFTVQLWAADGAGNVFASVEHQLDIGPPEINLELEVSNGSPGIGESVEFRITSSDKTQPPIEGVRWNFGGLACDETSRIIACTPSETDNCLTKSFIYSSAGLKGVWVMLQIGGNPIGPLTTAVHVLPGGQCEEAPQAEFTWWPAEPMQGQRVRCVDKSSGGPDSWVWSFDDGTTSMRRHPVKIFEEAGQHEVSLEVSNDAGVSTVTKTILVRAVEAECGNSVCEPGENHWNCAADCGDGKKNSTGRTGRKNTGFAIPAAAGGIPGNNGTYWMTDGTIINPGENEAGVIIQFFPDEAPDMPLIAGPAILPPRRAIHFDNIVTELFGVHKLGGIWIDSSLPIIVNTRTFNQTAEGTLGQAIGGISKQDILGEGDGGLYLLGLSQSDDFRTNILLQEVTGHDSSVVIEVYNSTGGMISRLNLNLPAGSRWQKGLPALGIEELEDGYALVSVGGGGRIAVLASKIDQRSGDATTIDPIHHQQMEFTSSAKAEETEEHFLVAVVARDVGANNTLWRSEMSILNPDSEAQTVELRYIPSEGGMKNISFELGPGEVFATPDVLANYFPEVGNDSGALHVYSEKALAVSSRTYNLLPTDATVGQSIPGLAEGDMARPGEVWLLDSLRDDSGYRCNIGFAEFEGNDTEVTLVLFDTSAMAQRYLGYRVYSVAAYSQLQINRVFNDFGIDSEIPQAIGYLSIASEKGAVYGYASIVDNAIGDGTTILAKRQ